MDEKALIELLKDMLRQKQKETKYLFISLVVVVIMNILTIGAFLSYESQMETVTTTTTEQTVDGEGNDIVNGDQYNDEAQNKGVVNNVSNTDDN